MVLTSPASTCLAMLGAGCKQILHVFFTPGMGWWRCSHHSVPWKLQKNIENRRNWFERYQLRELFNPCSEGLLGGWAFPRYLPKSWCGYDYFATLTSIERFICPADTWSWGSSSTNHIDIQSFFGNAKAIRNPQKHLRTSLFDKIPGG